MPAFCSTRLPLALIVLVAALVACKGEDRPAKADSYTARGKVVQIGDRSMDIHHELIPAMRGFDGKVRPMEAMTMPFAFPARLLGQAAVGDLIRFTFEVHFEADPTLRLTAIEKLPPETQLELR